jgi:hypothetical protein
MTLNLSYYERKFIKRPRRTTKNLNLSYCCYNSTCGRANGLYPILIALAGAHFPGRKANYS